MPASSIEVNGKIISAEEIRGEMTAIREDAERNGASMSPEERMGLRERAIESLIDRTLILQEAERLKLLPTPAEIQQEAAELVPRVDGVTGCRAGIDTAAVEREASWKLTTSRLIEYWCRNVAPPRNNEIRDYYREHRDEFWSPGKIRASHIVKNFGDRSADELRASLTEIRERLIAGEDFATLAKQHSDCPENGGDLGYFGRDVMVPEFAGVVFDAPIGEISPIFQSPFGLHIAVVRARHPEGYLSFDDVGWQIRDALHRAKQDREVGRRLYGLREKAIVREVAP